MLPGAPTYACRLKRDTMHGASSGGNVFGSRCPAGARDRGAHSEEMSVYRAAAFVLAATLIAEASWAQQKPLVPMSAVSTRGKLTGKNRVMYLLRQLDLTPPQRQRARALMDSILAGGNNPELSLDQVYDLMAQIQDAQAKDDKEREKQLEQQLRALGKGSDQGEEEFFMNMEPELTAEQKALLQAARQRLERNPSGALRPVDIFRLLSKLNCTKEQQAKFEELENRMRQALRETKTLKDKDRFQLMNGLLVSIRKELTPEQAEKFALGVNEFRPDLTFRLRVKLDEASTGAEEDTQDAEEAGKPSGG
jgi:Spy/CpxP family protein refolding chaperone